MFELFRKNKMSRESIAAMLHTSPELLEKFERSYQEYSSPMRSDGIPFPVSGKEQECPQPSVLDPLVDRIVGELAVQTKVISFGTNGKEEHTFISENKSFVGKDEVYAIPEENRPQLTGRFIHKDIEGNSYPVLLEMYHKYLQERNPEKKKGFYNRFRQGLDILDLDGVMYRMLELNPNSMGFWLPAIFQAVADEGFFKVPATKIMKVPLPILQLTRQDFLSLTPATKNIVNRLCHMAFALDDQKEYFIKTGTFSNKFDFRNAYIHGASEVQSMGEYFLYTHSYANSLAHYDLYGTRPVTYGVSTTNEWVVREFVPALSGCKQIYHGLPLRTEYRVFADFDSGEVIGISPYWEPKMMKNRFGNCSDSKEPDMVHDYITYSAAEPDLMKEYEQGKEEVIRHVSNFIRDTNLSGQWSVDIMQNGSDFWLIDMALAENSALYGCVPEEKRRKTEENWIPDLSKK